MNPPLDVPRMSKREFLSTGVVAFAAGVAVGARWPHSTHILGLLMEKLGFDLSEILFMCWDPEARERAELERQLPAPHARAKPLEGAPPGGDRRTPRRVQPQAVVRIRRFSSRPALSAA